MKRRNLSGIFIFDQFENEEKKEPTCFEDCQESTQDEWLASLSREDIISLAKELGKAIRKIGDELDIVRY